MEPLIDNYNKWISADFGQGPPWTGRKLIKAEWTTQPVGGPQE